MYRHILVPLDGSGIAEQVVAHVELIARASGSDVTLLWVTPPVPTVGGVGVASTERWEEEYNEHAEEFLGDVQRRLTAAGISVSVERPHGIPAAVIIERAAAIPADLIAMTTHGRSGLQRMALGSVADEVVRRADSPVLLVRAK